MKAEDTVISRDDVAELVLAKFGLDLYQDTVGNTPAPEIDETICLTQAKVSFEAGGKQRDTEWIDWLKKHNRAFEIPNLPLGYPLALDEDDYWATIGNPK